MGKFLFSSNDLILFSFILVLTFNSVTSTISCYQCLSTDHTDPFQCGEYMSDDVDMEPKSCDNVYGAAYCIKQTGRFEGGLGTKRFCSSLDLGNYCNYIRQPGDVMEYRSCVFTCDSDGCNTATHARHTDPVLGLSLLLVFKYSYSIQATFIWK